MSNISGSSCVAVQVNVGVLVARAILLFFHFHFQIFTFIIFYLFFISLLPSTHAPILHPYLTSPPRIHTINVANPPLCPPVTGPPKPLGYCSAPCTPPYTTHPLPFASSTTYPPIHSYPLTLLAQRQEEGGACDRA